MKRLWFSLAGVIAVAAIVIGVNLLAERRLANAQLDLTQQRLYTLSEGTRTILAGLKQPVTLRLFFSPRLGAEVPVYGAYADRVREMLRRYASVSGGKVRLEFLDPEPFSDTEDRAVAYGLQGAPLDRTGEAVYFGLAGTNQLDDQQVIAFLQPDRERFLEYDLTKLVQDLSSPARPVVGVMSSLPIEGDPRMMMMMRGQGGRPWLAAQLLRESNTVKTIPLDAQVIDKDVQVLLLVQPQGLSDATLYAIDQFVMRGGRLMAMVDPFSESQSAGSPAAPGQPPPAGGAASSLPRLFDAWGIAFDPSVVVADPTGAWRVRARPGDRVQSVDYIAWFNITNGIAHDDPATADLKQVTVASAGALARKDGATIDFTPLLTSSARSGTIPVAKVGPDADPARILADFHPEGGGRVIAARIRGVLKSAFTGPPDLPAGATRPADFPAFLPQTDGPANLVVVADTDILADRFWVQMGDFLGQQQPTPFSDNGAFVADLVGTLAGGDALIGLRSRGDSLRPFDVVETMQRDAEARYRQTEQTLQKHLEDTEKTLRDLRAGGAQGASPASVALTQDQRTAIDAARADILYTRQKLRGVQLDLRRDISRLETQVRLADIVLVPAVLVVLAIGMALVRRRRRAQARA